MRDREKQEVKPMDECELWAEESKKLKQKSKMKKRPSQ